MKHEDAIFLPPPLDQPDVFAGILKVRVHIGLYPLAGR